VDKLHWAIDSLVLRDDTCFCFGWLFHEEKKIRDLKLLVRLAGGGLQSIRAEYGKLRSDVAQRFSGSANALHSGYVLLGSFDRSAISSDMMVLQGTFLDGIDFEIGVPQKLVDRFDMPNSAVGKIPVRQLINLFRRGFHLLRSGQIDSLLEKAKRYISGRPKSSVSNAEMLVNRPEFECTQRAVLIIDHDLGGGANQYRERLVAERIDDGDLVFILSYHVATLSYVLMVKNDRAKKLFAIPGYGFVVELADHFKFHEIYYNTGVSFTQPEGLLDLMLKLKKKHSPDLILLAHDYFMVCPSHFLLNADGRFCGIPGEEICVRCLRKNQQGFASLFQSRNILQWRAMWSLVINAADEVRTFSNNTLTLIRKAYPALDFSHAVVKPHKMNYLETRRVCPSDTTQLKIGVVGHIGYHKGAQFIHELALEIKGRCCNIQIVVIGDIEVKCDNSVVLQTGQYRHDQLLSLIEGYGVNIALFPSNWPETFSYVVQELIELDLPVACFDLGAQAERISSYAKGLILREPDPSSVLDELILFHQRIYLT